MTRKEARTDKMVAKMLDEAGISYTPQGSDIKEVDKALKTASKKGTGNSGAPEFTALVNDFLIVIEDKPTTDKQIKMDGDVISQKSKDVQDYAVNGALHYAKHIAKNTNFKKIIALGVSGDDKHHEITPLYVDDRDGYMLLDNMETFISFSPQNIQEYYYRNILKEKTDKEKELSEILKDAKELHEHLRNYGNLRDTEKPLVVSGILLALAERDNGNFNINDLKSNSTKTDGEKIYDAINTHLKTVNVEPEVKRDKILAQFSFIKDTPILSNKNDKLGKSPLRYFAEFLDERIYKSIRYNKSNEDYIGRFYGEFMSYSGGDGQSLGIILTPKHICELFCELADLKPNDVVFDPCCGTGGFLISAMHNMLGKTDDADLQQHIRREQLHGIEIRPDMFTVATTNMILRGDGKSNLVNDDFFSYPVGKLKMKSATVGMMNPPYSQGTKDNTVLYEINFIKQLLDSLTEGARCVVIVPQSTMTGKTIFEKGIKKEILNKHTLEGVITLNKDTFYGVGVMPCIAVFTAGIKHNEKHICKFINFEDDGYKVAPHIGLLETESAKDKRQHLLDVWNGRAEDNTNFVVKTTIDAEDEWLHSFYYFNDEIPTEADFDKTIGDYLSFEFSMIMQGRKYLFEKGDEENA